MATTRKATPAQVKALRTIADEQVIRTNSPYDGIKFRVNTRSNRKISAATITALMDRQWIRPKFLPHGFDSQWRFADRVYEITDAGWQALPKPESQSLGTLPTDSRFRMVVDGPVWTLTLLTASEDPRKVKVLVQHEGTTARWELGADTPVYPVQEG